MSEEYNLILICNGGYKDFYDDGELFCGGAATCSHRTKLRLYLETANFS